MLTTTTGAAFIDGQPTKPEENIMRVKITRATVANGGPQAPGTTLDLPEREARYLINLKKATAVGDLAMGDAPAEPENREAEVEQKATKRSHKKK
jgi:hypothetical protein